MTMFVMRNSKGFTILEVMTAMVVLAFGILGVAKMQLTSTDYNRYARTVTEATTFGTAIIEQVLSLSYKDPLLDDGVDITDVVTDPSSGEEYTVQWKVYDSESNGNTNRVTLKNVKQIDIRVSWDNNGRPSTFQSIYFKSYTLKR